MQGIGEGDSRTSRVFALRGTVYVTCIAWELKLRMHLEGSQGLSLGLGVFQVSGWGSHLIGFSVQQPPAQQDMKGRTLALLTGSQGISFGRGI